MIIIDAALGVRPSIVTKGVAANVSFGLINAVRQWCPALEGWLGSHFLISPALVANDAELLTVLQQWWPALEARRGCHFLLAPPATYQTSAELRSLLQQWWPALESWRGARFLVYPA